MIKNAVSAHISRGKIDVFVSVNAAESSDVQVKVNDNLLKSYLDALAYITDEYKLNNDITAASAARFPDVLVVEKADVEPETVLAELANVLNDALEDYDEMREREGQKLQDDISSKLLDIEEAVEFIEMNSAVTVENYRNRLIAKMNEVLETSGIDESRIITEAAIFADHIAVDEETVRLRSHISQLRLMLETGSPIGRKIDFLVQEFNREANTIGSKCQNSDIAHVVVNVKSEIEKIREQVQNIE